MDESDFERLVSTYYEALYRFALSLTRHEAEACDLVQQTFYLWATKGHQLREKSKVKSWLFTTLHREFLGSRRRGNRFPHHGLDQVEHELPSVSSAVVNALDGSIVMEAMMQVDELYRAQLMLFYLEDHSYQEIADLLEIPTGTVMSRLSRGKAQIRELLSTKAGQSERKIVSLDAVGGKENRSHG